MGSGRDVCVDKRARPLGPYLCSPVSPPASSQAADLIWEVENPFRFFKPTRSFALHEAAFNAVRGDPAGPLPADIIWRTERRSTIPTARMPRRPTAARRRPASAISKAGWAGRRRPSGETCYESNGRPRRYSPSVRAQIFLGQRRRKITCCRRRTRSRSASRPACSRASPATASGPGSRARPAANGDQAHHLHRLRKFSHIVVIYQENHSFDNLYGMWGDVAGKRVNDLRSADAQHRRRPVLTTRSSHACRRMT